MPSDVDGIWLRTVTWEQRLREVECVICGAPTRVVDHELWNLRNDGNLVMSKSDPLPLCTNLACVMSDGVIEPPGVKGALCSRFFTGEFPKGAGSLVGRADVYVELFESAALKWSPDNSMYFSDSTVQYATVPEALIALARFVPPDEDDVGRHFHPEFFNQEERTDGQQGT